MPILLKGLGVIDPQRPPVQFTVKPPPFPYRVHERIKELAEELAGLFYEGFQTNARFSVASDDLAPIPIGQIRSKDWRLIWPTAELYIAWCWPLYVKTARATLASMLHPNSGARIDEKQKMEIYEALKEQYRRDIFNEHLVPIFAAMRERSPTESGIVMPGAENMNGVEPRFNRKMRRRMGRAG